MILRQIFFAVTLFTILACYADDKPLFMGLIIKDNDASVETFLNRIATLEYDKRSIRMRVDIVNKNPDIVKKVKEWCRAHANQYSHLTCEANNLPISTIKNSYLREECCDWIVIASSDIFLNPFTLRSLIQKNLPIITPLLRPLPKANDPFRNFFLSATETGYYKDHPDYNDIAERKKTVTSTADCVHGIYIIRATEANKLNFEDGSPWDFIAFSNVARKNHILQFLCNEREFGHFIHTDGSSKKISLPWLDHKINRDWVLNISKGFQDRDLKEYQASFPIELYTLYSVGDDLYWVDDKWDLIKSHYIKKGLVWEPHIVKLFKKYVKEGETVIDIGGHIGTHTILLSRLVGTKGKVHVFEPQTKLFTELAVNTNLNNCNNVIPHRVALGSKEGEAFIAHPCSFNEGMGQISHSGERVQVKTLDSFNLSDVSLIKIDIEGYEIEALKGAMATLQRNKPVMIVEVFSGPECATRLNFIRSLGYKVSHLQGDDYLCLPIKEGTSSAFKVDSGPLP